MECARPAVIKGQRLRKRLTDDVACFVWKEQLRVKWDNLSSKGGALGCELWVEGFKVKEDRLFGLLHLFCTLAGDGDEKEMFLILFHMRNTFKLLNLTCASSEDVLCGTRFYNNAAKIFGTEWVLCRRFDKQKMNQVYKESGRP